MNRKHRKEKEKTAEIPSTGLGAASALDAMIKRRAATPRPGNPPPPAKPDKQ